MRNGSPFVNQSRPTWRARAAPLGPVVCLVPLVTACDPILDIDGAFFPAWMLCMILGIGLAFACHPLFVRIGIQDYLGPPVLIYPCLALLITLAIWLVFFGT